MLVVYYESNTGIYTWMCPDLLQVCYKQDEYPDQEDEYP